MDPGHSHFESDYSDFAFAEWTARGCQSTGWHPAVEGPAEQSAFDRRRKCCGAASHLQQTARYSDSNYQPNRRNIAKGQVVLVIYLFRLIIPSDSPKRASNLSLPSIHRPNPSAKTWNESVAKCRELWAFASKRTTQKRPVVWSAVVRLWRTRSS